MSRIRLSKRMERFQPSIFNELVEYKKKKLRDGIDMIDLSIGSPDLPPSPLVKSVLSDLTKDDTQYGYTLTGIQPFFDAVSQYYHRKYQIDVDPKSEVLLSMGSQDALVHIPMVFADPDDYILVPDPGYTAYATGIAMAGAIPYFMPLLKENQFLPDLSLIPEEVAHKASLMILNYPGNPIPAMASKDFFEEVIQFARTYNIIVVHDFAYGEFYFDGQQPISFLSIPGAKDVGIEVNSLSKSFSLAGCRIGYVVGNADIIQAILRLKSNLDYGVFLPIQQAAIEALLHGDEFCENTRQIYQERRDIFVQGLHSLGWHVDSPQGGMFVWAKVPTGWNTMEFVYALMDKAHVVVTPGHAFGPTGDGYVRIALVQPKERLQQAVENIKASRLLQEPLLLDR
jgi:LL-diaminopimelate aminotransferase